MLSCIISSTVARQFNRDSVYTESLRKKGIRFDLTLEERALRSIHVGDLKRSDVPAVRANERFSEVVDAFLKSRSNVLYVIGEDDALIGSIDIHDLKEFMGDKNLASVVIANDIAKPASFAFPEQSLIDVMDSMYLADMEQMPVVKDAVSKTLLGVISRRDIIGAYNREVLKKKILLTKFVTRKQEKEGVDFMEMPPGYRLGRITVSDSMNNKTLAELHFHSRYRLQVLECIRSEDGMKQRLMAEPDLKLKKGDALIVIGREENFQKYSEVQNPES
jgi:CBS domain-containing protein